MKIVEIDITQFPHFQKYSSKTSFADEILKSIILSTTKTIKIFELFFKVIFTYNHVISGTLPAKTIQSFFLKTISPLLPPKYIFGPCIGIHILHKLLIDRSAKT